MKVPFHDIRQRYAEERGEILACIDRVLVLPHAQHLNADHIEYVAEQVNRFYGL